MSADVINVKQIVNMSLLSTQEAPPLMPALTSGRYHIKWTQLADLPVPLCKAFVAVQHHKVYVIAGVSPTENAVHQVYVYDINYNQWDQLPPSGHYYGIPHIIGGRLVGMRTLCRNNFGNNRMQKESGIMLE